MLFSERKEVLYGASPNIGQCHSHPCTSPTFTPQHTDTFSFIDDTASAVVAYSAIRGPSRSTVNQVGVVRSTLYF